MMKATFPRVYTRAVKVDSAFPRIFDEKCFSLLGLVKSDYFAAELSSNLYLTKHLDTPLRGSAYYKQSMRLHVGRIDGHNAKVNYFNHAIS